MTTELGRYPIFWPGDLPFYATERGHWTREQTLAWSGWLQRAIGPRTDHLLAFFGVDPDLPAVARFAEAVDRAAGLCAADPDAIADVPTVQKVQLRGHAAEVDVGRWPSGFTQAVGTDLALLAARSLAESFPSQVHWDIVWKPADSISFRNPVLTTGAAWANFDPMLVGANMARDLVNGGINSEVARERYEAWERNIRFSS